MVAGPRAVLHIRRSGHLSPAEIVWHMRQSVEPTYSGLSRSQHTNLRTRHMDEKVRIIEGGTE